MQNYPSEEWPADRRVTLVLRILKGEISPQRAADQYGLTAEVVEDWVRRFLAAARKALEP